MPGMRHEGRAPHAGVLVRGKSEVNRLAEVARRYPAVYAAPGVVVVLLGAAALFGASLIVTGLLALVLAMIATAIYVVVHDGPTIVRAAAAKKIGVEPVQIAPTRALTTRAAVLPPARPFVGAPVVPTSRPAPTVVVPPPPPTVEANEARPAPTWREIREAEAIGANTPYVGFDLTRYCDLRLRWKEDLGSMFIVGMSGSGKTSAAVVLAVQTALDGGRLLIGDPHAREEEASLAGRVGYLRRAFMMPVAVDDDEILEIAQRAATIAKRRLGGDSDRSSIFLMIDEWTALLRGPRGKELEEALFTIGLEGRKVHVNAALFAQLSTIEMAGQVRNVATTTFAFRTRPDQARYAVGEKIGVDIRHYLDGQCYLMARRESFPSVQVPWIGPEDLAEVESDLAALRTSSESGEVGSEVERSALRSLRLVGGGEVVPKWLEVARSATSEVLEAYLERGMGSGQIAREILGAPEKGGQALMDARAAVEQVIRENVRPARPGAGEEDA